MSTESWDAKYAAAMDSVNLLNAGKPVEFTEQAWGECVARNVGHLQIVLAEDWPPEYDLQSLINASS